MDAGDVHFSVYYNYTYSQPPKITHIIVPTWETGDFLFRTIAEKCKYPLSALEVKSNNKVLELCGEKRTIQEMGFSHKAILTACTRPGMSLIVKPVRPFSSEAESIMQFRIAIFNSSTSSFDPLVDVFVNMSGDYLFMRRTSEKLLKQPDPFSSKYFDRLHVEYVTNILHSEDNKERMERKEKGVNVIPALKRIKNILAYETIPLRDVEFIPCSCVLPKKSEPDPFSATLGPFLLRKILLMIPPLERYFALYTCSTFCNIIRNTEDFVAIGIETQAKVAALNGHLNYLKYLRSTGFLWGATTCRYAAEGGHLNCLKYLHENGYDWGTSVCSKAALGGHLDCLKYAHENGCWWTEDTCNSAAEGGFLECLKYARENGCPWDKVTCESAALKGNLDCLKYAHENGCPWEDYATLRAAQRGNLDCLKYLHENGCIWDGFTSTVAARNGNFDCLKYAYDNGCDIYYYASVVAAQEGQLECLKFLHENGCLWDEITCAYAAKFGHLDCLKYAHENGCSWDTRVIDNATMNGHLDCLRYGHENGIILNWKVLAGSAASTGRLACLRYLCQFDSLSFQETEKRIRRSLELCDQVARNSKRMPINLNPATQQKRKEDNLGRILSECSLTRLHDCMLYVHLRKMVAEL